MLKVLGTTVQNLVTKATRSLEFAHSCLNPSYGPIKNTRRQLTFVKQYLRFQFHVHKSTLHLRYKDWLLSVG